jgi:hypothetical protein
LEESNEADEDVVKIDVRVDPLIAECLTLIGLTNGHVGHDTGVKDVTISVLTRPECAAKHLHCGDVEYEPECHAHSQYVENGWDGSSQRVYDYLQRKLNDLVALQLSINKGD